jgi:translation initiation factor IF-3
LAFNSGFRGPRFPRRDLPPDAHRINHRITAREVRVVSDEGEQLGVMPVRDALVLAERAELDLVEVAPTANPPVCRIMDYGKFKYKEQKKEAEARKKRTETVLKELRVRYITDVGDLETKLKQAREFLDEGDKVKFSMRFRGREIAYLDLGRKKFDQIAERLADIATVDERSPTSGRMIHIVFAPVKKKAAAAPSKPAPSEKAPPVAAEK